MISALSSFFSIRVGRGKKGSFLRKEGEMPYDKELAQELISLFDLKKSKQRNEKNLTQEAFEAQRDIRYLTLMFCDGIPDMTMKVTDTESIVWDNHMKKLLYVKEGEAAQILEAASKEIRVKMRPFLKDLVRKAREFYSNN